MSDIRYVTCGIMKIYTPAGLCKAETMHQLQNFGEKGTVLTVSSYGEPILVKPDHPALTAAFSAIETLLSEHPDCPCESRPRFNEVYMQNGTYRYAPFEELQQIMLDLQKIIFMEKAASQPLPNPAGITASAEPAPKCQNQIEKVLVLQDGWRYSLDVSDEHCTLVSEFDGKTESYRFPPSHPAYQNAIQRLQEINPLRMTDSDPAEGLHEIHYQGGTAPFKTHADKLFELLNELQIGLDENTENVEIERTFAPGEPRLQGAVACPIPADRMREMLSASKPLNEIEKVRVDSGESKYRLTAGAEQCSLGAMNYDLSMHYRFPPSHPAYQKALKRLQELCNFRAINSDPSEGIHEICFQGCTEPFKTHADKLFDILNELEWGLLGNTENVEIQQTSQMVRLQGAVAYNPQNETRMTGMMGMMGMMQPSAPPSVQPAPQPEKKYTAVLHEDGSWDCTCGTKALTGKFCYNCGAAKPAAWKCTCGAENISKFCRNCGAPKPAVWICKCGVENKGKFCRNCGAPKP